MTPWALVPTARVDKDARGLPADARRRIADALERWAETERGDLRAVQNLGDATHRLRVGDWRVLLRLDQETRTATVLRVLPRGGAYKP